MGMQGSRGKAVQARAYIIAAQGDATVAAHEPHPVEPRSKGGVVMEEDVAMAQLDGGVLAANATVDDLNGVLGKAADGRGLRRQRVARGLLAGGCREREVESWHHWSPHGRLCFLPRFGSRPGGASLPNLVMGYYCMRERTM